MSKIMNDLTELIKHIQNNPNQEDRIDHEEALLSRLDKFPHYFNTVITMEYSMKLMSPFDDPEKYKDKVKRMDSSRRMAHIVATDALNQINRLCSKYNMEPVFKIPDDMEKLDSNSSVDREIAADLIYGFCKEIFLDTKSKERYNSLEYTTDERQDELLHISENGYFKNHVSVDYLINQAKNDKSNSDIPNYTDQNFCL